jgi:hypothetical protein
MIFKNKWQSLSIFIALISLIPEFSLATDPEKKNLVERAPIKLLEFSYFDKEILGAFKRAIYDGAIDLNKNLKSYIFINRFIEGYGRAYNPSIATLKDGYLVCARVAVSSINEEIIPGSPTTLTVLKHNRKSQNFFWDIFQRKNFTQKTMYFKCNNDLKNCVFLTPINPPKSTFVDTRLFNNRDGSVYTYTPGDTNFMQQVLKVEATDSSGTIEFSKKVDENIDGYGKNFGVFEIKDDTYSYLDWFDKKGLYYSTVNRADGKTKEIKYLKYKNSEYPILGSGSLEADGDNAGKNSGITPLFSFSTPNVFVDDKFIGIGHIKINNDPSESYKTGSNIDIFKNNLEDEFKNNYGDDYIRFEANFLMNFPSGYNLFIYLLYFYSFKRDPQGNIVDFTISNSFLPVPAPNEGGPYRFSLIFPTGLTLSRDKKTLIIMAGYGDFHSVVMKIPVQDALNLSVHNVQNLDLSNYRYQIMEAIKKE